MEKLQRLEIGVRHLDHARFGALAAEILGGGSSFAFLARGRSMRPFLRHGDILTVAPCDPSVLRRGDILFCSGPGERVVVHRCIGLAGKGDSGRLTIWGDAGLTPPEEVCPRQVLGRVVLVQRGGRSIVPDHPLHRGLALIWLGASPVAPFLLRLPGRLRSRWARLCRIPFGDPEKVR